MGSVQVTRNDRLTWRDLCCCGRQDLVQPGTLETEFVIAHKSPGLQTIEVDWIEICAYGEARALGRGAQYSCIEINERKYKMKRKC